MSHFKNNTALARVRLKPSRSISGDEPMAKVYDRIGGLIERLAAIAEIEAAAALAVWAVESAAADFQRSRPILRFENHIFHARWGKEHEARFDAHFQFGGRGDVSGNRWEQHRFRSAPDGEWRRFHGDQNLEYEVFYLAAGLASREAACLSASFGGPQIMGFNHAVIGYAGAAQMFEAFSASERWHVCGFFDFCQAKDLLAAIREERWRDFATAYNGPGNAAVYEAKLRDALAVARALFK